MNRFRAWYRPAATIVAAALTSVGYWLPWLRKLPIGYTDGVPVYTSEGVSGLEAGIDGLDFLLLALVAIAVLAVAVQRTRRVPENAISLVVGALIVFNATQRLSYIREIDRYAAEPGIWLALAGGVFFVVIGVAGLVAGRADRLASLASPR